MALAAVVLAGTLPARAEDPPASPPGVVTSALQIGIGQGDFEFYVDATSLAPARPGATLVRVLVQLPLQPFLEQTRADRADLRLRVRAYDAVSIWGRSGAEGAPLASADSLRQSYERADEAIETALVEFDRHEPLAQAESTTRVEVASRADLLDTDFRTFELALELPPGDALIEVQAHNLSRQKRGILDRLRKRPMAAVARIFLRIPDLGRDPAVADPAFEFGHGERRPYAARLYGLLNDSLHVRSRLFGRGTYDVVATIADRDGDVAWAESLHATAEGSRDLVFGTSVNALPAGQYVLRLEATGKGLTAATARSFDVAWSLAVWKTSRHDLDVEAELALDDDGLAAYRTLPVGEKERFMKEFWQELDPDASTAANEVRDEFHRRVAVADASFQEIIRGALTDRGRVFVHFGTPQEIQAEAVPGHLAGEGGEEALAKVESVYIPSEHRKPDAWDQPGATPGVSPVDRQVAHAERERAVGPANEVVGYELWIYEAGGSPLLPADQALAIDTGLRVLFIDVQGVGRFELRKSSVRIPIRGLTTDF